MVNYKSRELPRGNYVLSFDEQRKLAPQTLRITCLTAMANLNGLQFLIEAYGISQTHAGRFGKYEDYLLEEELKEEIQMNP